MRFRLAGRIPDVQAAALYNFIKGGAVQRAIHQIKYRNRPDIAYDLGKHFGTKLLDSDYMVLPDILIPIPIHQKRRQQRGYNQCEAFASGISKIAGPHVIADCLVKNREIISQTKMNRLDRFDNVKRSFHLLKSERLAGKNVMIVDDVMTTGATLEAAWSRLKDVPEINLQLGIITLADG